jgi:hypothetical protein
MKIYLLLMLISVIVGLSYIPVRRATTATPQTRSDSLTAEV